MRNRTRWYSLLCAKPMSAKIVGWARSWTTISSTAKWFPTFGRRWLERYPRQPEGRSSGKLYEDVARGPVADNVLDSAIIYVRIVKAKSIGAHLFRGSGLT